MVAIFEVRNTANGKFYRRFKAGIGEVVTVSGVYETKQGCSTDINSIMSSPLFAAVKDQIA